MKIKVCLIQDSPVFFDKSKTLDKIEELVNNSSSRGAQLVIFPESFVPGYPRGFSFGATVGKRTDAGRELYQIYHNNSVDLESEDRSRLEAIASNSNTYIVLGITEKKASNGSLYCSMAYISPTSGLLGVHRKIKPTGTERLIWAEDDGSSLVTFDTAIGRMGGLICWENYMPLARMSMYQKGIELYIAPTADARDSWTATMRHIALEGRCFVLACNQYFTRSMYPSLYQDLVSEEDEVMCRGGSIIVSPLGEVIAGPLYDQVGFIIAELDLDDVTKAKLDFDANGHYRRADIFNLTIKDQPDIAKEDKMT